MLQRVRAEPLPGAAFYYASGAHLTFQCFELFLGNLALFVDYLGADINELSQSHLFQCRSGHRRSSSSSVVVSAGAIGEAV